MENFITIDGHCIAYTSAGSTSNPPLLLLHGLMSHRGVWSRTIETLQQNFYCIAIDHLGFGDSDKPDDGDYSITRQAERALKVANHFGFEKFAVIGHSMGGQIATYLAASLAPQRIQKLVSVDGVVTGKLSARAQNLNRLLVLTGAKIPAVYDLCLKVFNASKLLAYWGFQIWFLDPKVVPFASWRLDRHMAMNSTSAISALRAWDSLNATDLTPCLGNISAPTLVIFGKQDGTVPVEQSHLFKEKLPEAQLLVIDQCGHFPMYEAFDQYIEAVWQFLK